MITNTTISGNAEDGIFVKASFGDSANLFLDSVTIANNGGEGILVSGFRGNVGLQYRNTVLADANGTERIAADFNSTSNNPTIVSLGHNLLQEVPTGNQAHDPAVGDLRGVDAMLAPLADNGGPTPTHAPLPGSPIIDAGFSLLTSDQRGLERPIDDPNLPNGIEGNGADIGAFELSSDVFETPSLVVSTDRDLVNAQDQVTSLREAIALANTTAGADTISFAANLEGSVITLGGTELEITESLTIDGSALSDGVTLSAGGLSRVLNFTAATGDLTLDTLTIADGFSENSGGGIQFNSDGQLLVQSSTLHNNQAFGDGGAISSEAGSIALVSSTVSGNTSDASGGGIHAGSGDIQLVDVTLVENTSQTSGGGIFLRDSSGQLEASNSIIASNIADGQADDIVVGDGATVEINASLIGAADGLTITSGQFNQLGTVANPIDPLINPLADNGGPTPTHALRRGSPAIDAGDSAQPTDQRGFARAIDHPDVDNAISNATVLGVDMGAFETPLFEDESLVVTTTLDVSDDLDQLTSLREAVAFANRSVGIDTITFDASLAGQFITLGGNELAISESLVIDASDLTSTLTIDANDQSRVLHFTASTGDLTLDGLTITGGRTVDSQDGAGIFFGSAGTLFVNNSTIAENQSSGSGGGIGTESGSIVIDRSTISDNDADLSGGGISSFSGSVSISSSTLNNNDAVGDGGAIHTTSGSVEAINSTISRNRGDNGGGISSVSGDIFVSSSTVFQNSGQTDGGGVIVTGTNADSSIEIDNSIVADNRVSFNVNDVVRAEAGELTINHSLIGNADGLGTINGNVGNLTGTADVPLNPMLRELNENGGPTRTHAPLEGSPVVDAGNSSLQSISGESAVRSTIRTSRMPQQAMPATSVPLRQGCLKPAVWSSLRPWTRSMISMVKRRCEKRLLSLKAFKAKIPSLLPRTWLGPPLRWMELSF